MNETEQDIDEYACPYCGTMWYSIQSEGAPCGIDGCMDFHCCEQTWKDHIKKIHPTYDVNKCPDKCSNWLTSACLGCDTNTNFKPITKKEDIKKCPDNCENYENNENACVTCVDKSNFKTIKKNTTIADFELIECDTTQYEYMANKIVSDFKIALTISLIALAFSIVSVLINIFN
jgi:hypothetical protein